MVNRLTHERVLSHDLSVSGTDAGPPDQKRGGEMMTTLADVAAAAGVSKAAASLVLSGKFEGRVSERKAERVRMAADELGYVRDAIAGGMPVMSNAGIVINPPPPAIASINDATKPTQNNIAKRSIPISILIYLNAILTIHSDSVSSKFVGTKTVQVV